MRAASQWSQRASCTPKKLAQRLVDLRPAEPTKPKRSRVGVFAVLLFFALLSAVGVYRLLS